MANQYSFQMRGPMVGGGFGARLGDLGPQLYNALQAGMQTRNDMMDLENRERLNPEQQQAQQAQYNAAASSGNLNTGLNDLRQSAVDRSLTDQIDAAQQQQHDQDQAQMIMNQQPIDSVLNLPTTGDDSGDNGIHVPVMREPYGGIFG